MKPILEVCCGNLESVHAAVRGGAERIELCSALEQDGLTPPTDVIRTVRRLYPDLVIQVLIRPRPGNFCYDKEEVGTMATQIEEALEAGADGIVIGCLDERGDPAAGTLLELTRCVDDWNLACELNDSDRCHASNDSHFFAGMPRKAVSLTFHRAFDVCRDPFAALESIIGLGFDRILTSGQASTAEKGIPLLKRLAESAGSRIILLPGGGVTPENAARILSETGSSEIHASASVLREGRKCTSPEIVASILKAINP